MWTNKPNESSCISIRERLTRLFHWGPVIALGIIFFVSIVTVNAILHWWPPADSLGGFIHFCVYMMWFYLIMNNYLSASFLGPGFVPYFWKPAVSEVHYLQYCQLCEGYKPPRSHHCRKCDRCVLKMDHHCPWINSCCGHLNHGYFVYFLLFAPLGSIHSSVVLIITLYKAIHLTYYAMLDDTALVYLGLWEMLFTFFAIGLAVGVVLAVGGLWVVQMRSIMKNETGIESWIKEKAMMRARDQNEDSTFVYPYDLGRWKNIREVLTWSGAARGDGCVWPVCPGCSQYDLTLEQKQQKREKALLAEQYRVVRPYSGSILPLFSYGPRICCSPPCTDEPRMAVHPGQIVLVTRWRKNWLYGQLLGGDEKTPKAVSNGTKIIRRRGWLPRPATEKLPHTGPTKSELWADQHWEEEGVATSCTGVMKQD